MTPLSYIPGGRIEKYLGNLNFFFIRETSCIREVSTLEVTYNYLTYSRRYLLLVNLSLLVWVAHAP